MNMKILDELERLVIKPQLSYEERHLLELHRLGTLPALIRVARAAERLSDDVPGKEWHVIRCELEEALQQLRDLSGEVEE